MRSSRRQDLNTHDWLEDDADGIPSPAQLRKVRDPDIDYELFGGLIPAVNRPGLERPRTIQEQIAFEYEVDAFARKAGWA